MKKVNGRYVLYGNKLKKRHSRKADKWQKKFIRKFNYDPQEEYSLAVQDNPHMKDVFGLKNIVRDQEGESIDQVKNGVIISTIRMGYGHYRIAMAGASAARAMGYDPYWLDLLSVPGITTDVIKWCNNWYSHWSRMSQKSSLFNRLVWERITSGEPTNPIIQFLLERNIASWNWRHIKTNVKDYKMSELFRNLFHALPKETPLLTAHMWNCMGAKAGGMENVVDMVFDNWPMAFQLTEGAIHAVQSPSAYYSFRVLNGFGGHQEVMNPMKPKEIEYVGHHIDHELVKNIEYDCEQRIKRTDKEEPLRFLITMGGAGAQRELFKAVIDHIVPLAKQGKVMLFVNMGDHKENYDWLMEETKLYKDLLTTHKTWEDTKEFADGIRDSRADGVHLFYYDNIYHAVYATNYLMRVVDVMITKPSELAFYPIPKIFNARVGGHELWGAVRGAEIGDSTIETKTIGHTLQAIDLMVEDKDLVKLYSRQIIKNKSIGIYDGAYKSVALATGQKFDPAIRDA